MGRLEQIIKNGILALTLVGCSKTQESVQPKHRTVTFSNGMNAYGRVEVLRSDLRETTIVHADHDMEIHDEGFGNVYVIYEGRRLPNLTYGYGGRRFPVWEPYAFRESQEYQDMARELSRQLEEPKNK